MKSIRARLPSVFRSGGAQEDTSWPERVGALVQLVAANLHSGHTLLCGLPPRIGPLPGGAPFIIDPDRAAEDGGAGAMGRFLERKVGEHRGRTKPSSFDLATIAADYPADTLKEMIEGLRQIAHSRSVFLFVENASADVQGRTTRRSGALRWLAELLAGRDEVQVSLVELDEVRGWLASGLDREPMPSPQDGSGAQWSFGVVPFATFVARNRRQPFRFSKGPAPAEGAPHRAGGLIRPRYNDVAHPDSARARWSEGDGRSAGIWWGRQLKLLPVHVAAPEEIGFLFADGNNRSVWVRPNGDLLSASVCQIGGYGAGEVEPWDWKRPTHVFDVARRRHPPECAQGLLTERVEAGDFFLLGRMDKRFGHFLLESLAGAWALPWALGRNMRMLYTGKMLPFMAEAFELLGVEASRLVAAKPGVRYERVHVPEPGHRLYGSVSPALGDAWNRMGEAALARYPEPFRHRFLYLSRAGVGSRELANEVELEEMLTGMGGLVVSPQHLSFTEQVALVRKAPLIVGCVGSQLHLSMFAAPGTRKLVIGNEQFVPCEEVLISVANDTVVDHYIEQAPSALHARTASWSVDLARLAGPFEQWLVGGSA